MNTRYLMSEWYKNAQNTRINDNNVRKKYENLSKKTVTITMFCYEYTLPYVRMVQKRTKHTNQR